MSAAAGRSLPQLPDLSRAFDRLGNLTSKLRKNVEDAGFHRPGPQPAAVAGQAVQPAILMQPVPVTMVAPVVSSAITMPPYIAKPKGKGFFGGNTFGSSYYGKKLL